MAKWYVKDLSKLTKVSVQTLHHYDRIGLLKPSYRLSNGYRLYSEKDLIKLQQVIALKSFGLNLSQIKAFLNNKSNPLELLTLQEKILVTKVNHLQQTIDSLRSILADLDQNQPIPWKNIINLIEGYNMSHQIDHSWVKEILTPSELKQYIDIENKWQTNASKSEKEVFENKWQNLVKNLNQHINIDPTSSIGISIGKSFVELIHPMYGKEHAHLRLKIGKGMNKGIGLTHVGLDSKTMEFLDKCISAYWLDQMRTVLKQVDAGIADDVVFASWNTLLENMYGNSEENKTEAYNLALEDKQISEKAKTWLKTLQELVKTNKYLV